MKLRPSLRRILPAATLATTDRLASDLEIASAIVIGVDPSGYSRTEPSGKDTLIIVSSFVVSAEV